MEKISLHLLSNIGFIYVAGVDTDAFLQGQLSNDLRLLTTAHAQLTSYNSPKGRMLAVLHLTRTDDGILMQLERSVLESTLKRLRLFVLRAKVTLTDASEKITALGISGAEAPQALAAAGLPAPAEINGCSAWQTLNVVRVHGMIPRFVIHGPVADIAVLANRLSAQFPIADAEAWRRLEIVTGVPAVFPQTSDHFVPQMANLDLLGGISFNKGCYTGQEIVARLHYLGQLKRRMFHGRVATIGIEPGTPIYATGSDQSVGEVVQSAAAHEGSLLSVVLQLAHAQSDQLHVGTPDGPCLSRPHASSGLSI